MANKAWYLVPLVGTAVAGFAFGYYHQRPASSAAHRVLYYVDPMHPSYRSDKPGKAPDCGMDLVAVYADSVGQSLVGSDDNGSNGLTIDSAAQKIYGIQLASVKNGAEHAPSTPSAKSPLMIPGSTKSP